MDLDYLRQMIVLSKTLNFSKTAEQFFITQSTLSKHVKIVENEIGKVLFDRNSHFVQVTKEGKLFIKKAENLICYYDHLFLDETQGCEENKTFVLGYSDILRSEWETSIIQDVRRLDKGAVLKKRLINSSHVVPLLKKNEIDFAIGTFFPGALRDLEVQKQVLTRYPLTLVCPQGHKLTKKEKVSQKDLKEFIMLGPDRITSFGDPLYDFFSRNELNINEEVQFASFYEATMMVSMGMGLAILPSYVNEFGFLNICFLPLVEFDLFAEPTLIWLKDNRGTKMESFTSRGLLDF